MLHPFLRTEQWRLHLERLDSAQRQPHELPDTRVTLAHVRLEFVAQSSDLLTERYVAVLELSSKPIELPAECTRRRCACWQSRRRRAFHPYWGPLMPSEHRKQD